MKMKSKTVKGKFFQYFLAGNGDVIMRDHDGEEFLLHDYIIASHNGCAINLNRYYYNTFKRDQAHFLGRVTHEEVFEPHPNNPRSSRAIPRGQEDKFFLALIIKGTKVIFNFYNVFTAIPLILTLPVKEFNGLIGIVVSLLEQYVPDVAENIKIKVLKFKKYNNEEEKNNELNF